MPTTVMSAIVRTAEGQWGTAGPFHVSARRRSGPPGAASAGGPTCGSYVREVMVKAMVRRVRTGSPSGE